MLKLSLSKLENARVNPVLIAQSLAQEAKNSGGSQGFASTFKVGVRDYHENDVLFEKARKNLDHRLWTSFKDSPENNKRRAMYCESFADYAQQFNSLGFKIDTFQINLDWEIIPQAKLTGHSPFLCSTNDYNVAYYFNEHGKEWRNELKYPLLQIYLADRYFHCDVGNIKIGIYNISNKKFDLHTYEDFELDNAIEEGKYIFKNVLSEYNRIIPRK